MSAEQTGRLRDTTIWSSSTEIVPAAMRNPYVKVALGAILVLGGVFLLLAAFQVLPPGGNLISRWMIGSAVFGTIIIVIGAVAIGSGIIQKWRHRFPAHSSRPPELRTIPLPPPAITTQSPTTLEGEGITLSTESPAPPTPPTVQFAPVESREEERKRLLDPVRTETFEEIKTFVDAMDVRASYDNKLFKSFYRHALLQGDLKSVQYIFAAFKSLRVSEPTNWYLPCEPGNGPSCVLYPLYFAMLGGNLEVVKLLVENGAKIVSGPYEEHPIYPLLYAVQYNQIEIASYLMSKGASCGGRMRVGIGFLTDFPTFLGFAASHGMKEMVELLVAHKASINLALLVNKELFKRNSSTDEFNIFRSAVQLLLDHSMGVDFTAKQFEALQAPQGHGCLDVSGFNFLGVSIDGVQVTREADSLRYFTGTDKALYTMTDVMKKTDVTRRGELMKRYTDKVAECGLGANLIPLNVAAAKGEIATLTLRLEQGIGCDINQKTEGMTALYSAVEANQKEVVEFLLERGADPFVRCSGNAWASSTAPLLAAQKGYFDILDLFDLEGHVDDREGGHSEALLHYAVWHGNIELIETLIQLGADLNLCAAMGRTPVHYAIEYGQERALCLLIERGANVHTHSSDSGSPLDAAVREHALGRVQMSLLERLLPHFIPTPHWYVSPLFIAACYADLEAFVWLHQKGAHLDAVNEEQQSIFDYVAQQVKRSQYDKKYLGKLEQIKSYIEQNIKIS